MKECIIEANTGGQGLGWLSIYFSVQFVDILQNGEKFIQKNQLLV